MRTKDEIKEAISTNLVDIMFLPEKDTTVEQVIKRSVLTGQLQALEWALESSGL